VLLLLPPSEGKSAPRRGPALDLDALSSPVLTPLRRKVLDALVEASGRDDAAELLGVGAGLVDEVRRNTALHGAPTARAASVYTGVLYAAAGLDRLTPAQRRRAAESVRVVSALWGAVTPDDLIPAYRLSMGTELPGVGALAPAWRDALGTALDELAADDLVVDARSAAYLAAWRPPRGADWVAVRVEREAGGVRQVVSHHAKHTRGVLTRHLLTRRAQPPRDADGLAHAASALVGGELLAVELDRPVARGARTLTLVVA
jgi:cytoplasmic iron level regulating protein YaaA (DUF328/UPF0246 family)